ncbi:MAG: serine hydrolase domain-containing protein [Bacteroidales bacterium]|jgi:CubicO group peptidase (beta-lactamase class C family)|nr:serine hydrolase domain-containing protein [Bacteroidales bacterium]
MKTKKRSNSSLKLKVYFNTFLLTAFSLITCGQTESIIALPKLIESQPETEGMSSLKLSYIDTIINNSIFDNEIPGAVVLVARNGKIVYHKAFGKADNSCNRKLEKDDIFRIASQTKAITATALMMLWEEGKFHLDDPISKYIPEFNNPKILESFNENDSTYTVINCDHQITIRNLLTHTSGLGYGFLDRDERIRKIYHKNGIIEGFTTEPILLEDNIKKLAELPLLFNPGDEYNYCLGLDVLGYLIEVLSGNSLHDFFKIRLFEPLRMDNTWFYLPHQEKERLVPVQVFLNDSWEPYQSKLYDINYLLSGAKSYFSGGAGLSGTAEDYAIFLQMLLNNGELNGVRILSPTTIDLMMTNQIGDLWGKEEDWLNIRYYSLAFSVLNENAEKQGGIGSKGTFEWGGYFNTQYFADPNKKIIGILYKQTMGANKDHTLSKFRQIVFASVVDE